MRQENIKQPRRSSLIRGCLMFSWHTAKAATASDREAGTRCRHGRYRVTAKRARDAGMDGSEYPRSGHEMAAWTIPSTREAGTRCRHGRYVGCLLLPARGAVDSLGLKRPPPGGGRGHRSWYMSQCKIRGSKIYILPRILHNIPFMTLEKSDLCNIQGRRIDLLPFLILLA